MDSNRLMEQQPVATESGGSAARAVFLVALMILAGLLGVGLYQVPQPWRGWLIAWLLIMATVGVLLLRFLRHYLQYKTTQLTVVGSRGQVRQAEKARPVPRVDGLKVTVANPGRGKRYVLR